MTADRASCRQVPPSDVGAHGGDRDAKSSRCFVDRNEKILHKSENTCRLDSVAGSQRVSREYVHGLEIVPSWRTPHYFYALEESLRSWLACTDDEDLEHAQTQYVFTHGLLVHDVVVGDLTTPEGVRALGERVGFEWLGSYADTVLGGTSALTRWAKSISVKEPGQESSRHQLGDALPSAISGPTLTKFSSKQGVQLGDSQRELEPFVKELRRAARKREAPRPTESAREYVRSRVGLGDPRVRLDDTRLVSTSAGWAFEFPNLRSRVWFELFELFEARPTLHLCPLCERVYVPRTAAQTRCQRALYAWPAGSPIRSCVPQPKLDADRHRREYKRLAEALRRARRRHKENSPRTLAARAELDAYRRENYGLAGRPPRGEVPVTVLSKGR